MNLNTVQVFRDGHGTMFIQTFRDGHGTMFIQTFLYYSVTTKSNVETFLENFE